MQIEVDLTKDEVEALHTLLIRGIAASELLHKETQSEEYRSKYAKAITLGDAAKIKLIRAAVASGY